MKTKNIKDRYAHAHAHAHACTQVETTGMPQSPHLCRFFWHTFGRGGADVLRGGDMLT